MTRSKGQLKGFRQGINFHPEANKKRCMDENLIQTINSFTNDSVSSIFWFRHTLLAVVAAVTNIDLKRVH